MRAYTTIQYKGNTSSSSSALLILFRFSLQVPTLTSFLYTEWHNGTDGKTRAVAARARV